MRTYANAIDQAIDLHSGPTSGEADDSPIDRGWFVRATDVDNGTVTYVNVSPLPYRLGAELVAHDMRHGAPWRDTGMNTYDVVSNYGALGLPPECTALGHDYISTGACRRCSLDHAESDAWEAMETSMANASV